MKNISTLLGLSGAASSEVISTPRQTVPASAASQPSGIEVKTSCVASRRSMLREERHPNAVTAPPVNRSSMVPTPWRGFWKSMGEAFALLIKGKVGKNESVQALEPWQRAVMLRRRVFTIATLITTAIATALFAGVQPNYDNAFFQYGQLALFAVLSAWVVIGFTTAVMGFWVMLRGDRYAMSAKSVLNDELADDVRTAIIMPICNEDVSTVFAGLRATCESIASTGRARNFDVFVLSDSNDLTNIAAERKAWEELRSVLASNTQQAQVEVYYRLRTRRVHRKSGNVADFCRRWGKDYRYMVVLDADSVMSGDSLVTLAKLMEANPTAGIIQTATQAIGHVTLHARVQQFASRVIGRLFTAGMQFWQLGESHYFGHNAIIRLAPFMKHCALAPIKGHGGLAGDILSHDFVEAAMMHRGGYFVWMVSDIGGSFEQQPPDLLSELQRDRRWCQGNMQNFRLIAEPGFHSVHRAMFATGAMSYVSAPLWLVFLSLGTALWLTAPVERTVANLPHELVGLWAWTIAVLFMPRVLGVLAVLMKGEQRLYGGTGSLLKSSVLEAVIAMFQAPIRMVAHTLFVIAAITGIKLDWKSPPREALMVPWREATARFASMSIVVAMLAVGIASIDPSALIWLVPVGLPLLLAIPMAVLTSDPKLGLTMRNHRFLLIPEESWSPAVLRSAWRHARHTVAPLAGVAAAH